MSLYVPQVEMVNEHGEVASPVKRRRTGESDRLSALEDGLASSGPHEAVALLVTAFPPLSADSRLALFILLGRKYRGYKHKKRQSRQTGQH